MTSHVTSGTRKRGGDGRGRGRGRRRHRTAPVLSTRAQLLVFGIGFALRLLHVLAIQDSPYFDHPIIDASTYDSAARQIAAGRGHPDLVFWQPPGYSYFLSFIYSLSGGSFFAPRIIQAILGAGTALLTARAGALAFGREIGLAAGLGTAFYGTLIHDDAELLAPALTHVLQLGSVELGLRALQAPSMWRWAGTGFLTGLAATVTATTLVWAAVFAAFARRHAPAVLLAAAAAIMPLTWRNAVRGGEAVLISTNAGINLYIGNNARYDQMVGVRPDLQWKELVREPVRAGIQDQAAASLYFTRKVLEFAVKDPVGFLALQGKKIYLLLSGNEIPRNQAIYPRREESPILAILLWKIPGLAFPWGLLAPTALVGLAVTWRRTPLLATLLLTFAVTVVAFFVTARYRLPLVPLAMVFAAAGVVWLVREADGRHRIAALTAWVALYAVSNIGQGPMDRRMNADAEYSLGARYAMEGNAREARRYYLAALEQRPDYAEAWINLGVLDATEGRPAKAEASFRRALAIQPDDAVAMVNLGILCERSGRYEEARNLYRRALTAEPGDTEARRRLSALEQRLAP